MVDANWHNFSNNGDADAFSAFYHAHVNALYAYGLSLSFSKEICKDAIQDVFCKIFVNREKLKAIENMKAYLFRAYKNRLIDIFSKSEQTEDISSLSELSFKIEVDTADIIIDAEETDNLKQKVENLLNSLTPRQREAVYLRYMQQMEYDEIAPVLKMSSESVRKLVHRAIVKLRKNPLPRAGTVCLLLLSTSKILEIYLNR